MSYKLDTFAKEIVYIKDERIRKFVENALESLPDYFFTVPASSTGKYHPSYTICPGGLVKHVRACVRIAVELYRLEMFDYFDSLEKDLMLASLILHDGYKNGKNGSKFSVTTHPIIMAEEIKNLNSSEILDPVEVDIIVENIKTHMGQWVEDYLTKKKVLEKPRNKMQIFVHLVDYLASRKCLEMNFDVELTKD